MDDVFALCAFRTPLEGASDALREILKSGMPPNIKVGELRESTDLDPQAGLLHLICTYANSGEELEVAKEMVDILFEYGANWMLLDGQSRTAGDIAFDLNKLELYDKFIRAGFRSEILLQKFVDDSDSDEQSEETSTEAPAVEGHNETFLNDRVKYDEHTLKTSEKDGVMMDWETPIMEKSAKLITKPGGTVLNIGFGMGIIDNFIQALEPKTHYIIEAHPDVLQRMKDTKWYEKPNVVVLEGTWKKHLPRLIEEGVRLDGIYYDTFSEHYKDMLDLFDYVVGLLKFDGTFSYFNGLGADRQICYDVYKEVAKYNLKDYGLDIEYETIPVSLPDQTWGDVKREYFKLAEYALPIVRFSNDISGEEGELLE